MPSKIRVGIDVDGVLRDFVGKVQSLAFDETGLVFEDPDTYYFDTPELSMRNKIWGTREWLAPVFEDAPVIKMGRMGYNKFCTDPMFEVYIVSHQQPDTEQHTDVWLEKNGFDAHDHVMYLKDKTQAPCQILIDDYPVNVQAYLDISREAYLISQSYNKQSKIRTKESSVLSCYNTLKEKYGI